MQGQFFIAPIAVGNGLFSGKGTRIILGVLTLLLGHSITYNLAVAQPVQTGGDPLPVLEADESAPPVEFNLPSEVDASRREDYLLGVGDYLRVDVFNIPDYGGEFRVLSGGVLNLPIAGAVPVEGLSLQQAATQVERSLEPFVRRPLVTLSVLETRPLQIAIAGEVGRPGTYQIANMSSSEAPTLTHVIELAGGITQLADIRLIEIQRQLSSGSNGLRSSSPSSGNISDHSAQSQGQSQTIPVNLWTLLQEGDLDEDLRLQDGDRILIPTATALNADEATELASASFSPDEITIHVVGEVDDPGAITVPPNTPLNQALLTAGGFNNRARRGAVNLIRLNPNGTVSQREIEVDFSQGINDDLNPPLRPNDTIVVQRSGLARVGDDVGTLLRPVRDAFNILNLFGL